MSSAVAVSSPRLGISPNVLAGRIPASRVRTAAFVLAFALLTALAGQFTFTLPWTPVPITMQTFAVLLAGASLGWQAGAASQILFVFLGAIGFHFFAGGAHGWHVISGATGGYLIGFIVAALVVGKLAEMKQDREFLTSIPAMLTGTAIIYVFGATWLAHNLHVSMAKAVELGVAPFLIGDTFKLLLAGLLLPITWKFVKHDS
jgi:biotin transport system substrate-specific component